MTLKRNFMLSAIFIMCDQGGKRSQKWWNIATAKEWAPGKFLKWHWACSQDFNSSRRCPSFMKSKNSMSVCVWCVLLIQSRFKEKLRLSSHSSIAAKPQEWQLPRSPYQPQIIVICPKLLLSAPEIKGSLDCSKLEQSTKGEKKPWALA